MVSRDNKQVYVANYATDDITVIDATLNSVSATIPLPANSNPFGLAQTLDSSKLYVTGWSSNSVFSYAPSIAITAPLNGATFTGNSALVTGTFTGLVAAVTVNGVTATLSGNNFSASVPLVFGNNTLVATAAAVIRLSATQTVNVTSSAPSIAIASPMANATLNTATVAVSGTFNGPSNTSITVNGVAAAITNNTYSATVPVRYGANTLTANLATGATTVGTAVVVIGTLPSISITAPAANATIATSLVTVSGTFQGPANSTVSVNGVAATVTGNTYTAANLPLTFGSNTLTVTVTAAANSTASTLVTVNSTQPVLNITAPAANATIAASSVTVSGTLQGPANSTISVNGVAATVTGNTYTAANVPLIYGSNTLTVTVTAPDNSTASAAVTVTSTTSTLTITSPADGASINGDSILVSGTLLAPINTGVTVNGVVTNVDNGKFYANNVPLQRERIP